MSRLYVAVIAICCCILPVSASNTVAQSLSTAFQETAAIDSVQELPLPNVPMSLRTPADRANYIINHFWDAMDFRDTLRSYSTAFMEQNFSNFISVFPYADGQARQTAVKTLLDKAAGDSAAYVLVRDIAEKYLYDPNSPMLSEDYYILFLECFVNSSVLGEYSILRLRRQLEAARKNRPGMLAADFAYTTRDGNEATLHKTVSEGDLLLIFYDPDCEHCKEIMKELQASKELSNAIASGKLKVLAVYSGEDHDLWKRTVASLPDSWTVGYESGVLQENGSYVLRALPTLYLLDRNKKVLLKDALPAQLFHT